MRARHHDDGLGDEDIEYRGVGLNKSSGTYFGFVDSATPSASSTTDVTLAPPYTWRP